MEVLSSISIRNGWEVAASRRYTCIRIADIPVAVLANVGCGAVGALRTLRAGCASVALIALIALLPLWASRTGIALRPLRASCASVALIALIALIPLISLDVPEIGHHLEGNGSRGFDIEIRYSHITAPSLPQSPGRHPHRTTYRAHPVRF